jgi:hypothetical protein
LPSFYSCEAGGFFLFGGERVSLKIAIFSDIANSDMSTWFFPTKLEHKKSLFSHISDIQKSTYNSKTMFLPSPAM